MNLEEITPMYIILDRTALGSVPSQRYRDFASFDFFVKVKLVPTVQAETPQP